MSHDTVFHCFAASNRAAVVMEWTSVAVVKWFYDLWFRNVFAAAYDAAPSQIIKDATRAMLLDIVL